MKDVPEVTVTAGNNMGQQFRLIDKPREEEIPASSRVYINLLPDDGLLLSHLCANSKTTVDFIGSLPQNKLTHRYAEGKWTIKEMMCHMADDERIYAYRALRFARNDSTELPGFNQDRFALYSCANERPIADLLDEFSKVRGATIALFNSLDDKALDRTGVADGICISVRALGYHIAGHELRHLDIVRERYL